MANNNAFARANQRVAGNGMTAAAGGRGSSGSSGSGSGGTRNVAPFIGKLYNMLHHSAQARAAMEWADGGTSFFVTDLDVFCSAVLPSYFKHNNYSSFVRQLNLYGFHRNTTSARSQSKPELTMVEKFSHPAFVRGREDLIHTIHRKSSAAATAAASARRGAAAAAVKMEVGAEGPCARQQPQQLLQQLGRQQQQGQERVAPERVGALEARVAELEQVQGSMGEHISTLQFQNAALVVQLARQNELLRSLVARIPGLVNLPPAPSPGVLPMPTTTTTAADLCHAPPPMDTQSAVDILLGAN